MYKGIFVTAAAILALAPAAYGQQIDEREPFRFQVINNPLSLSRAIAIERVEDGFGDRNFITETTNTSTSVGALTEIQAILEGDDSTVDLTANPVQDNSGDQTTSSNQNADVDIDN